MALQKASPALFTLVNEKEYAICEACLGDLQQRHYILLTLIRSTGCYAKKNIYKNIQYHIVTNCYCYCTELKTTWRQYGVCSMKMAYYHLDTA